MTGGRACRDHYPAEQRSETVGGAAHDEDMAYTYMLLCADRTLYVGSTTDLERRMTEHRVGLGSEYTRHRLPVELVWYEQYDNVEHAFMREKQIQNWGRAKRLALIRGELGETYVHRGGGLDKLDHRSSSLSR